MLPAGYSKSIGFSSSLRPCQPENVERGILPPRAMEWCESTLSHANAAAETITPIIGPGQDKLEIGQDNGRRGAVTPIFFRNQGRQKLLPGIIVSN